MLGRGGGQVVSVLIVWQISPQMFAKDFLFLATFRHIWSHWLDDFPAWVVEVAFQFSYLGKRHQITLR